MAQIAEAQARLNVSLRDIVTFLEESGVEEHSIVLLNTYIDKHLTVDFLTLTEGFGRCMAFIDHDSLISKVLRGYTLLVEGYMIERRIVLKRIKNLKEDKKADPEVVIRNENLLLDLDSKKTVAMVVMMRLKAMDSIPFENFKDPNFDFKIVHKRNLEAEKAKEKAKVTKK